MFCFKWLFKECSRCLALALKSQNEALYLQIQSLTAELAAARNEIASIHATAIATAPSMTIPLGNPGRSRSISRRRRRRRMGSVGAVGSNNQIGRIPSTQVLPETSSGEIEARSVSFAGGGLNYAIVAAAIILLALVSVAAFSKNCWQFQWFMNFSNMNNSRSWNEWSLMQIFLESSSNSSSSPFSVSIPLLLIPRCLVLVCIVLALWAAALATASSSSVSNDGSSTSSSIGKSNMWCLIWTTVGIRDALSPFMQL